MSHRNAHENRRVSFESFDGLSSDSTRTGFSYEDSIGRVTFLGTMPPRVFFTSSQHENIQKECIVNSESLRSYEIDRGLLQDMVTIGEGAFGVVAKATLLQETNTSFEKKTVAVKMLKGLGVLF